VSEKIVQIVSTVLALIFTASFILLWSAGKKMINGSISEYNSSFDNMGGYDYDMEFLDGAKVTLDTYTRFSEYYDNSGDVLPDKHMTWHTGTNAYINVTMSDSDIYFDRY
jgi:hypothetical protein